MCLRLQVSLHKKYPGAVKSGDLAGQGMLPVLEIRRLGNVPLRTCIALRCERTRGAFTVNTDDCMQATTGFPTPNSRPSIISWRPTLIVSATANLI
jgi:hypothetical protein